MTRGYAEKNQQTRRITIYQHHSHILKQDKGKINTDRSKIIIFSRKLSIRNYKQNTNKHRVRPL